MLVVSPFNTYGAWHISQSNPLFWYDPSDTSSLTFVGNEVSSMTSKGSNTTAVTQPTNTRYPIYSTDGMNGRPCLLFDGTGRNLYTLSPVWLSTIGSGAFTLITVMESSNLDFGVTANSAQSSPAVPRHYFTMRGLSYVDNQNLLFPTANRVGINIRAYQHNGISTAKIFADGTERGSLSVNASSPSVGCLGLGFNGGALAGKMSDVLVFNRVLSQSDMDKVTGWLAHNRNLTSILDANHPYKIHPPSAF